MLLYFKGIISEFHDIDLMVSVHDAEQVRTILSEMGELHAPASASDPMYRTKVFMEFTIMAWIFPRIRKLPLRIRSCLW
ncbi:MAG: hypothetical protein BHV87_14365 [Clostridiales bacterium 36_14]|nr:MAG: hypothetical protein BHV87_14365 [Clostridiales bacterium 36_14]